MAIGAAFTINRDALGSQVASALREAIASGQYARGERLIEADLAQAYGVSRGPIRDAFRILQLEGLVDSQQRGVTVIGIDEDAISEIYSLRGAIEGLAVRLAVGRADEAGVKQLSRHVDDMQAAAEVNDPAAFAQADIAFHNAICLLSGHKRLTDVWQQYEGIMMTLLRLTISLDQNLQASTNKHRQLLDLIGAGEPNAAQAELAVHLDGSRERMVKVWKQALQRRRGTSA